MPVSGTVTCKAKFGTFLLVNCAHGKQGQGPGEHVLWESGSGSERFREEPPPLGKWSTFFTAAGQCISSPLKMTVFLDQGVHLLLNVIIAKATRVCV